MKANPADVPDPVFGVSRISKGMLAMRSVADRTEAEAMSLLAMFDGWRLPYGLNIFLLFCPKKQYLVGMIPAAVALAMSQSRTSILAVAVGAIWVVFRARRVVTVRVVGAFAASVVVVTFSVMGLRTVPAFPVWLVPHSVHGQ